MRSFHHKHHKLSIFLDGHSYPNSLFESAEMGSQREMEGQGQGLIRCGIDAIGLALVRGSGHVFL